MRRKKMSRSLAIKFFVMIALICFMLSIESPHLDAVEQKQESPSLLVIYSAKDGEINEHQRLLDMLLGHFSENIQFTSSNEITKSDLESKDYLFYYGEKKEVLPDLSKELINNFTGPVVAFGFNVEQLERFSFFETNSDKVVVNQAYITNDSTKSLEFIPQYIHDIEIVETENTEEVITATKKGNNFPLVVRHQEDFYFANHLLTDSFSILFAEGLHFVFERGGITFEENIQGYIRLEDIHPLVDPEPLMEIANILKEKQIPYMIAVIPIYTNPETGKQYRMSDSPKLLKVLKYMQDNGGSIILHGYTHQFRLSETGEGFEFWDVEHDMPVYHEPDSEVIIKTEEDFASKQAYEKYVAQQKAFEREYIEERVVKGIHELTNYGLYPLAFEAPHYTMSQNGYQVLSDYFSTYVGQLQISDEDWETMTSVPYISKPTILHGMELLPETIGYVDPNNLQAISQMMEKAEQNQFVRDGLVAGFYHPYLGVKRFNKLLENLEAYPHINWIDLKERDPHVQTTYAEIYTIEGEIVAEVNYIGMVRSSFEYITYHVNKVLTFILWCMAAIGIFAVISFIGHTIYSMLRKPKLSHSKKEEVYH